MLSTLTDRYDVRNSFSEEIGQERHPLLAVGQGFPAISSLRFSLPELVSGPLELSDKQATTDRKGGSSEPAEYLVPTADTDVTAAVSQALQFERYYLLVEARAYDSVTEGEASKTREGRGVALQAWHAIAILIGLRPILSPLTPPPFLASSLSPFLFPSPSCR